MIAFHCAECGNEGPKNGPLPQRGSDVIPITSIRTVVMSLRSAVPVMIPKATSQRARLLVALAAFLPSRNIELIDLDRTNEVEERYVERSGEPLEAPVKRPVRDVEFSI